MKHSIAFVIAYLSIHSISCQEMKSKEFSIHVNIYDLQGNAVHNGKVSGGEEKMRSLEPIPQSELVPVSAYSNEKGYANLKLNRFTQWPSGFLVEKEGYYATKQNLDWSGVRDSAIGKEIHLKALIKKIINPIAMRVSSFISRDVCIPKCHVSYSYDLELHDFLPPVGNGKIPDISVFLQESSHTEHDGTMEVTIKAQDEGGGFCFFAVDDRESGSVLWSDYEAPVNGYVSEFKLRFDAQHPEISMNQDAKQNFYFRVRPKMDPITQQKVWNYGKMYGPISLWAMKKDWSRDAAMIKLDSMYFNPNAGDRNVEFDPQKNLNKDMILCRP